MKIGLTGAASGFGKVLSKEASRRGHDVLPVGRKQPDGAEELVYFLLDVDAPYVVSPSQFAGLDCLVLNAFRRYPIKSAETISDKDLEAELLSNLIPNRRLIESYAAANSSGQVVHISSGASNKGYSGWLTYCIAKSAMDSLMRVYAQELPGIKFWSVSPGPIAGELNSEILATEGAFDWREKIARPGHPESQAKKILDLIENNEAIESGGWIAA